MIYDIRIEQRALQYIKQVLAQRPYIEVAQLLTDIEAQQSAQDEASALHVVSHITDEEQR